MESGRGGPTALERGWADGEVQPPRSVAFPAALRLTTPRSPRHS